MAKANKNIFAGLASKKEVSVELENGDMLTVTVKHIVNRDLIGISEDEDPIEAQMTLIKLAVEDADGNTPSDDDILDMPLYVMRSLTERILEFNKLDDIMGQVVAQA